ncbi:MAG: hypothetical protein V4596_07710 [Bdellovibrionota bacterium]
MIRPEKELTVVFKLDKEIRNKKFEGKSLGEIILSLKEDDVYLNEEYVKKQFLNTAPKNIFDKYQIRLKVLAAITVVYIFTLIFGAYYFKLSNIWALTWFPIGFVVTRLVNGINTNLFWSVLLLCILNLGLSFSIFNEVDFEDTSIGIRAYLAVLLILSAYVALEPILVRRGLFNPKIFVN